ncbi:MAG: redoxin family protein [Methanoregulaceae archaeon]|nr:redoxin family protein [Methanoregulaceae archaeon]
MGKNTQYAIIFSIIAVVVIATLLIFFPSAQPSNTLEVSGPAADTSWQSMQFRDALSGETHTIREYSGRPVIIQTFTISCPICTRQQQEIVSLRKELGVDAFTFVALDIDPDEQEKAITAHVLKNGFNGTYAASPVDLSRALLDQFGPEIISPSSAPIILVCGDGSSLKLPPGIKTAGSLKEALEKVC